MCEVELMGFAFYTENCVLNLYNLGLMNGQIFEVVCVGGGGGGGGDSAPTSSNHSNSRGFGAGRPSRYANQSGGAGGDIKKDYFKMSNVFENVPIVVGKTGTWQETNIGTNGETSSFGSFLSSNGGMGGNNNAIYGNIIYRPKGLTSCGGIALANSSNNIVATVSGSTCAAVGGGGYYPGCKLFGGTPGIYVVSNGDAKWDGAGLSGFMHSKSNINNIASYYTAERQEVLNMPFVFGGKNTTETGVICIYW